MRWLRHIWHSLTSESASTLVHTFVMSRIDYCNVVFAGALKIITNKLLRVLNSAARVVSGTRKFDRALRHLIHSELHWLDIPERVKYKLGVITRRCLYGSAPQYLAACCIPVSIATRQHLRSAASHQLVDTISPAYNIWSSGLFCSRSDVLELTAQIPPWPVTYWCCFWTITKNISFLRVLVYTVHQRHLWRCAISIDVYLLT